MKVVGLDWYKGNSSSDKQSPAAVMAFVYFDDGFRESMIRRSGTPREGLLLYLRELHCVAVSQIKGWKKAF
jgi:hypothetical protein